ncbi:MAG: hypothetical protein WAL10_06550 [Acetobacteraceae bacterium]|jgi:hypothetical protein
MDLLQSERRQRDVDDKPVDRLMRIVWDAPGGTQNHPGRQAQEQQRNVAQCGFPPIETTSPNHIRRGRHVKDFTLLDDFTFLLWVQPFLIVLGSQ